MVAHSKTSNLQASDSPSAAPPVRAAHNDQANGSDQAANSLHPADWGDQSKRHAEFHSTAELAGVTPQADTGGRRWWQSWTAYWDARRTPAFLVSLIFHMVLLLLLAVLSLTHSGGTQRSFDFLAANTSADLDQPSTSLLVMGGDEAPPAPIMEAQVEPPTSSAASTATLSELLREPPPIPSDATGNQVSQLMEATADSTTATFAATGVSGRLPAQRRQTALARGGTLQSEQAVELALQWLANHQLPNGGWSLVHDVGKCHGQCPNNGSTDRFEPAATGLSLLAFLGAGYTHREGKYRETVRQGVYYLQQIMHETPQGGSFLHQSERGMYNHGIAAFAICEAYQLTEDKDLKETAQQAIDFIVSSQNYQGGWGYLPKQPGDLTLSGWQIMALKSAYAAGLDVHPAAIVRLDPFLDSQQTPDSFFYGYGKPGKSTTCTAIGLLLRLFRGLSSTHPNILDGASFISKNTHPGPDAYFNYYSTLLLFHVGGPFWEKWNEHMREHLIATQAKTGHMAGSWFFEDPYGREGGRVYTTAMSAMTLEVYYRFAPIYQQMDVKFEL